MKGNHYQKNAERLLAEAGIVINGSNPWDIQVHRPEFYRRIFREGSLGLGESYMDGWWDCERLDEFFTRVLRAGLDEKVKHDPRLISEAFLARIFNRQSRRRAFIIGERHYDLGNELFQHMLDKEMNYSCAYWKNAEDLDTAQEHKLDLICRKLQLKAGMRVLDIGCGWGSFAR
ncbi:MAG: cyclopropane-fatty-acyl-phospholipid synthase, partial [Methanobacteriota archaeon]